jgi:hypothetical protein
LDDEPLKQNEERTAKKRRKDFGASNSREQGIDWVNDLIDFHLLSCYRKVEAISIL